MTKGVNMKRAKKGKKYLLHLADNDVRKVVVNCMFKNKVVFLDQDNRSYFTFTTEQVKQLTKDGDLRGI